MSLVAIGLSHRTAPVEQREKAALGGQAVPALLLALATQPAVTEAAALSTCNRTELYATGGGAAHVESALREALVEHSRLDASSALYALHGVEAARHLFAVAAGLDSMVIGESEIQGQVRAAAAQAAAAGSLGPELRALFRQALVTGKRVRSRTAIGDRPVSVASVAAGLARRALGELSTRRVLLIGAGRAAEATAGALVGRGVRELVVANRTLPAAASIARRFGARPAALDAIWEELVSADVVIASTGAPAPLLSRAEVEACMRARPQRALFLIDIAVPRDVEAAVGSLPNVTLYDIDDLHAEARANLAGRRGHVERAWAIVDEEVQRLRRGGERAVRPAPPGARAAHPCAVPAAA